MEIINLIIFFTLGSIMGSFLHVVATRLYMKESIITPRSHCHFCSHELKWYELIPILSYIFLGGKCKKCKKKLPYSYVIIEVVTGILYAVCYHVFGYSYELIVALIFVSGLVTVIISDIEYMVILDEVLITMIILIIITYLFSLGFHDTFEKIGYGALSFLTMYTIKIIGDKMFKKESLGGGDIKLLFVFGLVLGYSMSICTIFLATFIAFPIALIILFSSKDNIIPFGPFLCMAAILLLIWGINFNDIITFLIEI